MLNEKMQQALNEQVNKEMYAGYLYLAMSAYFEAEGLRGSAAWMRVQVNEEQEHAMKLFDYINTRAGRVTLMAIDKPEFVWDSPLAVFEAAYTHEQKVTDMINNLVELAMELKDHATYSFLQWYVDEQVEEEESALNNVDAMKVVKGDPVAMFMFDGHLGKRGRA